ncbi:hypothetical protein LOK49_LG01G03812 [Camellia lanceoleosa]|uniref:Uncharacterized protein n=1 Tax=Camellia lanceoleosa TaxID=1840588 RepID=A0ACC0J065_9ERIC|nr:hypothetical protein LOK49_LG01G03812 [Camellia lanceoleosa]
MDHDFDIEEAKRKVGIIFATMALSKAVNSSSLSSLEAKALLNSSWWETFLLQIIVTWKASLVIGQEVSFGLSFLLILILILPPTESLKTWIGLPSQTLNFSISASVT